MANVQEILIYFIKINDGALDLPRIRENNAPFLKQVSHPSCFSSAALLELFTRSTGAWGVTARIFNGEAGFAFR